MKKILTLILVASVIAGIQAQVPQGTNFLNKETLLTNKKDKYWFIENIPFLEVPDQQIQEIYYYRWFSYYTNVRYTYPSTGFVLTEFSSKVSWESAFGTIPCAGSQHFYEGRWLKNQNIMNDYAKYWAMGIGSPSSRNYSFWMAKANYERYLVSGNEEFIKSLYQPLVDNFRVWGGRNFDNEYGLYWQEGVWDGMELSATSYQAPPEGPGYRPTINSYMFADAESLSKIATMIGDNDAAKSFKEEADTIRDRTNRLLWDSEAKFFKHRFRHEVPGTGNYPANKHYNAGDFVDAREVYSYTPWYTDLAKDDPEYIQAWEQLFDPQGFYATYGPTTLERRHRLFLYNSDNCCRWNGMSWPFSTAQTLTGMANVLNNYENKGILNKDKYYDILKMYTRTQYKNGTPYVAEAHHPDNNVWSYDLSHRSQHYNHSTYNDLIISGLIGIRPQADNTIVINPLTPDDWTYFMLENVPYHGHLITVLYDKTGSRYGQGAGFKIYENGNLIHSQATIGQVTLPISAPNIDHNYGISYLINYATNLNQSANAGEAQPSASFTSRYDDIWAPIDGRIRFEVDPKSRWTNWENNPTRTSDWYALNFNLERTINRIDVLFFADNAGTRVPTSYKLEYFNESNKWEEIPEQVRSSETPLFDRNIVHFPPIKTKRVRIVMEALQGYAVGLTEFEVYKEISTEPEILTTKLPNVLFSSSYSTTVQAVGGIPPYSFEITEGNLPSGISINNTSGIISGKSEQLGIADFTVRVTDSQNKQFSQVLSLNVLNSTPYKGIAATVPGILEMENYDVGGEGVSYHDTEETNKGNEYRTGENEGVDIFAIKDGSNTVGYGVGWTMTNEWLDYTVDIKKAGKYNAAIVYATPADLVIADLLLDNQPIGTFNLPSTGGYGKYQTVTIEVNLPEGTHKLRYFLKRCSGGDFDNITFTEVNGTAVNPLENMQVTTVFPNPTKGFFTLNAPKTIDKVLIFDVNGNLKETVLPNTTSVTFGQNYAKGLYIVCVYRGTQIETFKVEKL